MCQVPVNYRALKCPLGHAAITLLFHKTQAAEPTTLIREQNNRSEEHTSELQSHSDLVCRLLLEKKNTS